MAHVLLICRFTLAAMFAIAVVAKLAGRDAFHHFVSSLRQFGLPAKLAGRATGVAVVVAEAAAAIAVVVSPRPGGAIACVLLAGFAVGIAGVLRNRRVVHCRCFGASGAPIGRSHLVRNLVLAAIAAAIAIIPGLAIAEPAWWVSSDPSPSFAVEPEPVIAALIGVGLGALISRWDDLVFLFTPASPVSRRSSP